MSVKLPMYGGREGADYFRPMSLAEQQALASGMSVWFTGMDGSARRAKVTSVKRWKRQPERIEVHVKYGMYEYGCFTEKDIRLLVREPMEVQHVG